MGHVLTIQPAIQSTGLVTYRHPPDRVDQPRDGNIFQLPPRYRGMPKQLIPLYAQDSLGQDESNLIRMSDKAYKVVDNFVRTPTRENLEALLYVLLANEHRDYYPWFNMNDFRKAVGQSPDCGWMVSKVCNVLENRGCKVTSLWFQNGSQDAQYTAIIKTPCGKYFACDQAASCYGPEDSPWYYVMEAKSVKDAIDKLKAYFYNTIRDNPGFNKRDWHLLKGAEEQAISWIEERDSKICYWTRSICC